MKEGSLLQAGFDEEKLEKVVVHESEDGDDDAKMIQKVGNEANPHYEDKNLELMAPPNPLKCLSSNGKVGSSEDRDINSNAFPDQKDDQEEQVERAKSKVGIIREENERLKTLLGRAMKQYESLRMHLLAILQQQEASKWKDVDRDREPEVHVALSLGRNSSARNDEPRKEEAICSAHSSKLFKLKEEIMDLKENDHNLALTLNNCKPEVESQDDEPRPSITAEPVLSLDDCNIDEQETTKEEVAGEPSPPRTKSLSKTVRSHEDDEVSQPALVKKARVSVRARCDAPTMNDGCQWRKYGQKIAKGNPCPRAYYRCTLAPACPVRKQVQRCAEDRSILITTYEGTHNHPLPVAATAMASTTSAAAFMLTSSSSNSSSPSFPTSSNTTASANLHGLLNFSSNNNSSGINIPNYNSRPTYFFHSSSPNYSSISPSLPHNSHPTITLDLTATPPSSLLFSSTTQSNYVGKSSSSSSTFSITPRTSYCFYSSAPNHHNNTISLQPPSLGPSGYHNNDNHIYHGYYRYKNNMTPVNDRPEQPLISTETIAAATKAIASDPSFRSALAAAITSTIVGADAGTGSSTVLGKNSSAISTAPSGNRIECPTSLSNRSPSFSSSTLRPDQQASFTRLPSSLSFSSPKNKADTSPTEH